MASSTLLTVEQYLTSPFEWEPEYVRGELIERPMPTRLHGKLIYLLARLLPAACDVGVEVLLRIGSDIIRIPDLSIFDQPGTEAYPTSPPLVVVEVLSPEDRVAGLVKKCEEYRTWGVPNIWVIEPEVRKFYVYTAGLSEVERFELPEFGFSVTAESLFAEASAR